MSAAIDSAALHVIFGTVSELVEDVACGSPVGQVLRLHDRSAGHEVHGGADQIESVAHADDVWVGHVSPNHGIRADGRGRRKEALRHEDDGQ